MLIVMVAEAGGGGSVWQCAVVSCGVMNVELREFVVVGCAWGHIHTQPTYRAKTTGVSGSMCTAVRTLTS